MTPNVSVVIPNYNYGQYLGMCIQTVLDQTYRNLEVLVVDDGSTDDSVRIAQKITDPRVQVLTQENGGVSVARNRGIQAARGRWIAFLDADDLWTPDSLRLRVEAMEASYGQDSRPVLVCGQSLRVARFTTLDDVPKLSKLPPDGRRLNVSTILTERKLFDWYGWFRPDLKFREDVEMWYRLFGRKYFTVQPRDPAMLDLSKVNMVWIEDLCAFYRKHRRSATHTFRRFPRRWKNKLNQWVQEEYADDQTPG